MFSSNRIVVDQLPAVSLLEEVIKDLEFRLERYVNNPGAKQAYINRQNELLFHLRAVLETLTAFKYLAIWQDVEQMMEKLENDDSQTAGHAILIRTRLYGNHPSMIDKYWTV